MRILVFGDSNSWGFPPDGSGQRFGHDKRWPSVMASALGAEVIEDCLPGRTTAHDDPELLGDEFAPVFNGLLHLPAALKSASPVDLLLIMLGTNDFKMRFRSSAADIAANLARLVECASQIGGGKAGWDDATPPEIGVILPALLPDDVNAADWERVAEWDGAYAKSHALADAARAVLDVPIFVTGVLETGAPDDPIHLSMSAQVALGQEVANWVKEMF